MQTIYYSTPNFIYRANHIVDLGEYRRKLALSQEGSLAPQPQEEEAPFQEEAWEPPALVELHPRRRRADRRALALDICASLGVLAMTLTFTLRVLLG